MLEVVSPAAIVWLVIALAVDAVDGCFRKRQLAHVFQEAVKRFFSVFAKSPTVTDPNASCAISWIASVAGEITALHHAVPAVI